MENVQKFENYEKRLYSETRREQVDAQHGDAQPFDTMHRQVSIASLGVVALVSAIKGIGELT